MDNIIWEHHPFFFEEAVHCALYIMLFFLGICLQSWQGFDKKNVMLDILIKQKKPKFLITLITDNPWQSLLALVFFF